MPAIGPMVMVNGRSSAVVVEPDAGQRADDDPEHRPGKNHPQHVGIEKQRHPAAKPLIARPLEKPIADKAAR